MTGTDRLAGQFAPAPTGAALVVDVRGDIVGGLDTAHRLRQSRGFVPAEAITWQTARPRWADGVARFFIAAGDRSLEPAPDTSVQPPQKPPGSHPGSS